MENEKITMQTPEEELNSATLCDDCEELSVCNCENNETVTVYESEDCLDDPFDKADDEAETKRQLLARKCREAKEACQSTASRIVNDWKETNGNPYIKQTHITQIEIYRSPEDETPVDVFRTEQTKSYSARSFALLGAAAVVVACTVDSILKKVLK